LGWRLCGRRRVRDRRRGRLCEWLLPLLRWLWIGWLTGGWLLRRGA
jgi:hypothetical protein